MCNWACFCFRLNVAQGFAFSVAASDLAALSSMIERADADDDSNNQIAIMRSRLVENALQGAAAVRSLVAADLVVNHAEDDGRSGEDRTAAAASASASAAAGADSEFPMLSAPEGRHATLEEVTEAATAVEATARAALWSERKTSRNKRGII